MNSIIGQCVQKWNKLPQWLRLAKNGDVFKKTLNDFLLSQHEIIPLNNNVGAIKVIFIFRKKTKFITLSCLNDVNYYFCFKYI